MLFTGLYLVDLLHAEVLMLCNAKRHILNTHILRVLIRNGFLHIIFTPAAIQQHACSPLTSKQKASLSYAKRIYIKRANFFYFFAVHSDFFLVFVRAGLLGRRTQQIGNLYTSTNGMHEQVQCVDIGFLSQASSCNAIHTTIQSAVKETWFENLVKIVEIIV